MRSGLLLGFSKAELAYMEDKRDFQCRLLSSQQTLIVPCRKYDTPIRMHIRIPFVSPKRNPQTTLVRKAGIINRMCVIQSSPTPFEVVVSHRGCVFLSR